MSLGKPKSMGRVGRIPQTASSGVDRSGIGPEPTVDTGVER